MEIVGRTIAVLIDFDNFNSEKHLEILFDELEEMGNVIYKGAFYSNSNDKKVHEKGIKYGINDFIVEPPYTVGKNAVDIRIALDAMELLNKEYIDCFCLATHDSDFAPIVKKLREKNRIVIGAGLSTSKEAYKKLCHRFVSVDIIETANADKTKKDIEAIGKNNENVKTKKNKEKKVDVVNEEKIAIEKTSNSLKELIKIVNKIIENLEAQDDGFILFSIVVENIYSVIPDFNPKNYGAPNNRPALFFQTILKKYYIVKANNTVFYIKRK